MNPAKANESLYAATEEDNLPKLNEAIDAGADTEYKSPKELSTNIDLGRTYNYESTKELSTNIDSGRTYILVVKDNTSLHVACLRGFMPIVLRLLEINARVNAKNQVSLV